MIDYLSQSSSPPSSQGSELTCVRLLAATTSATNNLCRLFSLSSSANSHINWWTAPIATSVATACGILIV